MELNYSPGTQRMMIRLCLRGEDDAERIGVVVRVSVLRVAVYSFDRSIGVHPPWQWGGCLFLPLPSRRDCLPTLHLAATAS